MNIFLSHRWRTEGRFPYSPTISAQYAVSVVGRTFFIGGDPDLYAAADDLTIVAEWSENSGWTQPFILPGPMLGYNYAATFGY